MKPNSCQQFLWIVLAGFLVSGCSGTRQFRAGETSRSTASQSSVPFEKRADAQAHYSLGLMHEMNREREEAFEQYFLSVQADPGHTDLVLQVAQEFLQTGRSQEAREILEESLEHSPTNHLTFTFLGNAYVMTGSRRKAVQANRRAIELRPDSLAAYDNLVRLWLAEDDSDEAMKVLSEAAAVPDADSWFLLNLSDMIITYGRVAGIEEGEMREQVASVLERAMQNRPDSPAELMRLADGFAGIGELEKALTLFEQIHENSPSLPNLREKQATLYLQAEQYEKARGILVEMLRIQPSNPFAHLLMASVEEAEGDLEAAAGHLERVIRFPTVTEAPYFDLINLYLMMDEPTRAHDVLERLREDSAPGFLLEYYTAVTFNYEENYEQAIEHFLAAEALAEEQSAVLLNHTFYFQLGAAYERVKDYEKCEAAFRKSIELNDEFAAAMNYLGYTWAEQGTNLDEAYDLIRKAVDLEPENAAYLDSLAWVLFKQGKIASALSEMLKAIEHSESPDPTLYDHLGDIYNALGERANAENAWRQAIEIEPDSDIESKLRSETQE